MSVIERALDLFVPHICEVCGSDGNPVCNSCQNDIVTEQVSSCFLCNSATNDFLTCFSCRRTTSIRHAWRAAEYSEQIKHLVSAYKFDRNRALAKPLAQIMDSSLPYINEDTIVTFVPTATSRVRQRGFDHAELLAKELARLRKLDCIKLLARTTQTRQVGSTRIARRQQAHNMYRPIRRQLLEGAQVLLIDDITTTGATLTATGRALRRGGAKTVDAVVLARKN